MDAKLHGRQRNLKLKKQLPCRHVPGGVAGSWNEAAPGNIAPMRQAQTAAAVVAASGGTAKVEVSKQTPYIADLKPAGRFVAKDLFDAGSVPPLMKTLLDNGLMQGDCMTVTGCTVPGIPTRTLSVRLIKMPSLEAPGGVATARIGVRVAIFLQMRPTGRAGTPRRRHPSCQGGRKGVLCGYLNVLCRLRCSGSVLD
jgi:hypothetical protein